MIERESNTNLNLFKKRNSSLSKKNSINYIGIMKKEEIEKKIYDKFPELKDKKKFHFYFCSYDFHQKEKSILDFWREVFNFIYEFIKDDFAIRLIELKDIVKFNNRKPLGIDNIIVNIYYIISTHYLLVRFD
jgi:hypothetical protein